MEPLSRRSWIGAGLRTDPPRRKEDGTMTSFWKRLLFGDSTIGFSATLEQLDGMP
jgi:hypothetical protein